MESSFEVFENKVREIFKMVGGRIESGNLSLLLLEDGIHPKNLAREMRKLGAYPEKLKGNRTGWQWCLPGLYTASSITRDNLPTSKTRRNLLEAIFKNQCEVKEMMSEILEHVRPKP